MKKILSICTAAYNVENLIHNLLDTVIACKNKEYIEIIIVNDGSTDKTDAVVNEYITKSANIINYVKKENGGSGSAWNVAYQKAKGKYLKIIDADDYVNTANLDLYVDFLKDVNVDIIWNQFYKKYEQSNKQELVDFTKGCLEEGRIYDIHLDEIDLPNDFEMHGITYRTSIIQDNNIKISERVSYCDIEYLMLPIPFCKTLQYCKYPFYVYRLELTGQSVDPAVVIRRASHFRIIADRLFNFYKSQREVSDLQREIMIKVVAKAIIGIYNTYYLRCDFGLKNEVMEMDKKYRDLDENVWTQIGISSGSARLLRKFNYYGYYLMVIYHRLRNK